MLLATRIKVLWIFQLNFVTCLQLGVGKLPTRHQVYRRPLTSNQNLLKSVVYLALTPRENQRLFLFDGSGGTCFSFYVASKGVTNQAQKVALLLHSGGMGLQEISTRWHQKTAKLRTTSTIEGLRAKRAYIEFWPIFIFCRIELIFGRLTCFDMKSIVP